MMNEDELVFEYVPRKKGARKPEKELDGFVMLPLSGVGILEGFAPNLKWRVFLWFVQQMPLGGGATLYRTKEIAEHFGVASPSVSTALHELKKDTFLISTGPMRLKVNPQIVLRGRRRRGL